jgi:hypothetical protein
MSEDSDRWAMVCGRLARDFDEIFAIDLSENPLKSDPAVGRGAAEQERRLLPFPPCLPALRTIGLSFLIEPP